MVFSTRDFRDALSTFATGVCVVTCPGRQGDAEPHGLTVNSFASVSLEPPLVLWCLDRNSERYPAFADTPVFAVNILASEQLDLSIGFADYSWVKDAAYETWETGAPVLKDTLAALDCRVEARHDGGDHVIIVGRVTRLDVRKHGNPLIYHEGRYRGLDRP